MPDPTPHTLHHIPLAEINDAALTRDRSGLDADALAELRLSIAASGLRMPIEVFALPESETSAPKPPHRYGLLSGFRRLLAFRELHELTRQDRYTTIPAFLRAPGTMAEALTAMVEENEIREALSPWERGRIAYLAHRQQIFPTIEEAVARLYPAAKAMKRSRLRSLAHLAEELDGLLTNPESLSQQRLLRIDAAYRAGFDNVIRTALAESSLDGPQAQWQLLLPILTEAEQPPSEAPKRPGRPRRLYRPRKGLTIRREQTRDGYTLHFTGAEADSELLDVVFDQIERFFEPE
jgi:ParB family chromosome partitioning protein